METREDDDGRPCLCLLGQIEERVRELREREEECSGEAGSGESRKLPTLHLDLAMEKKMVEEHHESLEIALLPHKIRNRLVEHR